MSKRAETRLSDWKHGCERVERFSRVCYRSGMKDLRNGVCPLCQHNEIIESKVLDFIDGQIARDGAVAYEQTGLLIKTPDDRYPHGLLMMYVCRACGLTQTFAQDPGSIPIGDEYGTRLIRGQAGTEPYR